MSAVSYDLLWNMDIFNPYTSRLCHEGKLCIAAKTGGMKILVLVWHQQLITMPVSLLTRIRTQELPVRDNNVGGGVGVEVTEAREEEQELVLP